jgi:hypothetical protein
MTINSMEVLTAMATGTSIRVDSPNHGQWTFERTDQGWRRDGVTVDHHFFTGYVESGFVADAASLAPRLGDWYVHPRYYYWVREAPPESTPTGRETVKCLRFWRTDTPRYDPSFEQVPMMTLMGSSRVRRLADPPDAVLTHRALNWLVQQFERTDAGWKSESEAAEVLREEREVLKARPEPGQLRDALAVAEGAITTLRGLIGQDLDS